jgi:hypothetical protein
MLVAFQIRGLPARSAAFARSRAAATIGPCDAVGSTSSSVDPPLRPLTIPEVERHLVMRDEMADSLANEIGGAHSPEDLAGHDLAAPRVAWRSYAGIVIGSRCRGFGHIVEQGSPKEGGALSVIPTAPRRVRHQW